MNGSTSRHAVGVCLVMLAVAVPLGAQETATESGLPASALSAYTPPACVAGVPFADVTCTTPYDGWIEQFARDGITGGCGGGNYCPSIAVTRDQMAVFIERAMRGTAHWPPHVANAWPVKASDGSPDSTASATALVAAVASIPTSGTDAPSWSNPWLVKIGPGVYDLGSSSLAIPDYVAVEGAGRGVTVIQSTGSDVSGSATVTASSLLELRDLSIKNTGAAAYATALMISGNGAMVRRVDMTVQSASSSSRGIYLIGSGLTIEDSTMTVSSSGSGSIYGVLTGAGTSLTVNRAALTLGVQGTGSGAAFSVDGSFTGRNVNVKSNFYGNTTATISGVMASGSVDLRDSYIFAGCAGNVAPANGVSGGTSMTLFNVDLGSWRLGNASCTCTGANFSNAYGSIRASSIQGYNIGVATSGATAARTVYVDDSFVSSITNGASYTTHVGATRLTYGTSNSGTLTCAGVYTSSGTFYANTCP